jgi:peptidoglycan/LPS O-acetylase OafA/YrhL
MTTALSLYLDALRFSAALVVFVGHYSAHRHSGGLFWQAFPYGRTAVLVFFVLSGFVIAWISETKEKTLEEYALSRAARLYSVILPVLLITAVLDGLGSAIDPRLYELEWRLSTVDPLVGYALSVVFLGQSWTLDVAPRSDLPFWSLNYEAWYYVLFAAAVFLRGQRRMAALAVAALVAGPKIFLLFPVWLMGVVAWRWRAMLPPVCGTPLAFGAVALLIGFESLGGSLLFEHMNMPWLLSSCSPYDYIVGALVAFFIVGLANASLPMPGATVERLVRYLAGATFGLYLLHNPLLIFLGTVIPGAADRPVRRILLFGLTLGGSILIAHLIERQKGAFRRALHFGLDTLRERPLRPVLQRERLP